VRKGSQYRSMNMVAWESMTRDTVPSPSLPQVPGLQRCSQSQFCYDKERSVCLPSADNQETPEAKMLPPWAERPSRVTVG